MMKRFSTAVMVSALVCIVGLGLGCKRSKEKMKVPTIKMITKEDVHGVIAPDDGHIWICGGYGIIYHSSDGGENWVPQQSGIKESTLIDGFFINNTTGWIVGQYGVILHTANGGATWVRQDSGTEKHLFCIHFVDAEYGWRKEF